MTRITSTLHEKQCTFLIISRWILLTMRYVSDKSCRENQNTRVVFSNFIFFENHSVYEIMWKKYCRAGQVTDDIMAHAHFTLGTSGYKHTLTIRNTHYFSTASVVCSIAPQLNVIRNLPILWLDLLQCTLMTPILTFVEPCIARCVFYITNEMQLTQCSLLLSALYMFRAVFSPIIRSL